MPRKYVRKELRDEPEIADDDIRVRLDKNVGAKLEELKKFYGMKSNRHTLELIIKVLADLEGENRSLLSLWRSKSGTLEMARIQGLMNDKINDLMMYQVFVIGALLDNKIITKAPTKENLTAAAKKFAKLLEE